jgi:hypothetical protein
MIRFPHRYATALVLPNDPDKFCATLRSLSDGDHVEVSGLEFVGGQWGAWFHYTAAADNESYAVMPTFGPEVFAALVARDQLVCRLRSLFTTVSLRT